MNTQTTIDQLRAENEALRKIAAPFLQVAKEYFANRNDAAAYPFWGIAEKKRGKIIFQVGPFFSRARAEKFRSAKYDYRNSFVYCFSGHESGLYRNAIDAAIKFLEGMN